MLVIAGTSEGLLFLNSDQHVEMKGHSITALTSNSDGLWAIADRNSVWHRDLNQKWERMAWLNDRHLNCILSVKGAVLVGTSGVCLLRISEDKKLDRIECFNAVEGREEWYTPWGGPPDLRSMAVGSSGELYVNVHVGGILRSDNQGQSWRPTIDVHEDVHEVRTASSHPGLLLAATAKGLAISWDRGNSWRFDRAKLHDDYSRAVALCQETILMSASTGPTTRKAALYRRSLDESGVFEKCEKGLPEWFSENINTGTLATSETSAAFGTQGGQIYLSNDVGVTWQQIASGLAPIQCLELFSP
jgi:photosystem II stability/assembly factor-like uncharacterized protein